MNVYWQVSDSARVRNRTLVPGDEVSIRGERGRMRFVKHVVNTATGREWIDVMHPTRGLRSFRPGQVRTVHRVAKLRPMPNARSTRALGAVVEAVAA